MSQFKEGEPFPVETVIKNLLKDHLSNKEEAFQGVENNSFIFLEKNSLNLLLEHLFSSTKNEPSAITSEEYWSNAIEQLNQVFQENEKEFNAIINLLKEVT